MPTRAPARVELDLDAIRVATRFAVACARRVLGAFESARPEDARAREAIEAAAFFARGGPRTAAIRAAGWAALAASRDARAGGQVAAAHAARAACHACGAAYLHPLASPHQVKHVLGAAAEQAFVRELAAGGDPRAGERGLAWAEARATPELRAVLGRYPRAATGRARVSVLLGALDAKLRDGPPPAPSAARVRARIRALVDARPAGSVCPSEVARALEPGAWRPLLPRVRAVADAMAARGEIVVTQGGAPVDLATARGPVRLARPARP